MADRIELPIVTETQADQRHVSLQLIADGMRQVETNIREQEAAIRKLSEQLTQVQNMRIATIAQRDLLKNLEQKIVELEHAQPSNSSFGDQPLAD